MRIPIASLCFVAFCFSFLARVASGVPDRNATRTINANGRHLRRRLTDPLCEDKTCRLPCSECPADSYSCTDCPSSSPAEGDGIKTNTESDTFPIGGSSSGYCVGENDLCTSACCQEGLICFGLAGGDKRCKHDPEVMPALSGVPTMLPTLSSTMGLSASALLNVVSPFSPPILSPSEHPSEHPSELPSETPSGQPSPNPSEFPSGKPSQTPFHQPSERPSKQPSESPSITPSQQPSETPSNVPSTQSPSKIPSEELSNAPSELPSEAPSGIPSDSPSDAPTWQPSQPPSTFPSAVPTSDPSPPPSAVVSQSPTNFPSSLPTDAPSRAPTKSAAPSSAPSAIPSPPASASTSPSISPSESPSSFPSAKPSHFPSQSATPSVSSSTEPSSSPSEVESSSPSLDPSPPPSVNPSESPSRSPSSGLSRSPSESPTADPSVSPTAMPTMNITVLAKFLAFGDTPYDQEVGYPFIGPEYACLEHVIMPGAKSIANEVDFVAHVGDIKKGSSRFADFCDDAVFGSRRSLFSSIEPDLDFLLLVGDNEWNECTGYDMNPDVDDPIKSRWRQHFTTGEFAAFDRALPFGARTILQRQIGKPENFFFYYTASDIAFFGITEPSNEPEYNSVNANWISANLVDKAPKAIVVFGHARIGSSSPVLTVALPRDVPTLYIQGNDHSFSMGRYFSDLPRQAEFPNLFQLIVHAFTAQPFEVSILKDGADNYFFDVEQKDFPDPHGFC